MNSVLIALGIVVATFGIIGVLDRRIAKHVGDSETRTDLKFATVDKRLTSLENDMHLVKQHLIGTAKTP